MLDAVLSRSPAITDTKQGGSVLRVIIVGGGLAGMSAAAALESAGARSPLIESRKSLGGRASSFEDPQTGETLDNCQHVLLGCCTNLLDFYRRLGVEHLIRFERTIRFVDPCRQRLRPLRRPWPASAAAPGPLDAALRRAEHRRTHSRCRAP